MKAVVQRVLDAAVTVEGRVQGRIGAGLLVYLGVARGDGVEDSRWLADKIGNLRVFDDGEGRMNLSLKDISLWSTALDAAPSKAVGVLAVSQFTLLADPRKGRRPSYHEAAPPEEAEPLYEDFVRRLCEQGLHCESGVFRTHMAVRYTNDGPVTILFDSRERP
jgi:D-tyrosyl-tRNA(Tyr) deacylase